MTRMSHLPVKAQLSRREFLAATAAALLVAAAPATQSTQSATQRYKVAACDWMMLKRQKLGAFQLAKDCGLDGLEVDMGPLSKNPTFQSELGKLEVREQFLSKSRELGIEISSIAMSGVYAQSFTERDVMKPVQDCVDTMKLMNVKVAFLPLGVQADLVKRPELRPKIVEILKQAGAIAEAAGVVIGIETALDAQGEVKLLEDIASPAIRIYFNFSNALQNGRDLYA